MLFVPLILFLCFEIFLFRLNHMNFLCTPFMVWLLSLWLLLPNNQLVHINIAVVMVVKNKENIIIMVVEGVDDHPIVSYIALRVIMPIVVPICLSFLQKLSPQMLISLRHFTHHAMLPSRVLISLWTTEPWIIWHHLKTLSYKPPRMRAKRISLLTMVINFSFPMLVILQFQIIFSWLMCWWFLILRKTYYLLVS